MQIQKNLTTITGLLFQSVKDKLNCINKMTCPNTIQRDTKKEEKKKKKEVKRALT